MAGAPISVTWQLPDGWVSLDAPFNVVAAAGLESPTGGFGVNVQAITLPADGLTLQRIAADIPDQLAGGLQAGRLLDLTESSVDDEEALRVLATYVGERDDELTLEQWITLVGETQVVISATCPSLDYHWHSPAIATLIDGVELGV